MSFNSKAYLDHEERRLEPDSVLRKGNHKWHKDQHVVHTVLQLPPPDFRTEQELMDAEDAYLAKYNVL